MNESLLLLILIPAFVVSFVLIWGGVVWLIAWLSGWRALARHYRYTGAPKGQPISIIWARLGPVNYKGTLMLQPAPEGLYLSMMVLFRLGHPRLLIPWRAVNRVDEQAWTLLRTIAIGLGDPKITTLHLPAGMVDEEVLMRYKA